jgi:DNA-binding Lrp family transcriptional regulator
MNVDTVDWTIIGQLQSDGRTSFRDLGKSIGFSGLGAKKRVDKLLRQDVIRISALVNADALNLHLAMILLEMESAEALRKMLNRYRECPRVVSFFTTTGGYNLIALVMAENSDTLKSESMERCALRSGEGIRRSEFNPISTINHSAFLPLKRCEPSMKSEITPCGVDCRACPSFQDQKCVGCPSTSYYNGPLK